MFSYSFRVQRENGPIWLVYNVLLIYNFIHFRFSKLLFEKSDKLVKNLQVQNVNNVIDDFDQNPAWVDEDDKNFAASIMPNIKSKTLYVDRLKQKYETLMGTPNWAKLNKKVKIEDHPRDDEILHRVGHLHKRNGRSLFQGYLQLNRVAKINYATGNEGPNINCIEFHPKSTIALVAGQRGIVSLFPVGVDNAEKIHSFKLKHWHILTASFTPDGNVAYISGTNNRDFCAYDLIKAEPTLVPFPTNIIKQKHFKLSPNGKYIAISSEFDEVYIISTESRELLKILKHNTTVASITFSHHSKQLYSFGSFGEVTIWDLRTYKSVHKFIDNGCVNASCITVSPCGRLLATGSLEGIVNIYETTNLNKLEPTPLKVVSNLTTSIKILKFNPTTEILAMASDVCDNATKMIHIPSYTAFMNYPKPNSTFHKVTALSFSPNSGYMGIGNDKSFAALYRVKYYKNY